MKHPPLGLGIAVAAALVAIVYVTMKHRAKQEDAGMRWEKVQLSIDRSFVLNAKDAFSLIEPLSRRVNIYGSPAEYDESAKKFSLEQRQFFAIDWYLKEVNNGGHHQFFFNSTGVVWRDALDGLTAVGAVQHASVLHEAASKLGEPARERSVRIDQLPQPRAFDQLDTRIYESTEDLEQLLLEYAARHPDAFLFEGTVERPILPKSR